MIKSTLFQVLSPYGVTRPQRIIYLVGCMSIQQKDEMIWRTNMRYMFSFMFGLKQMSYKTFGEVGFTSSFVDFNVQMVRDYSETALYLRGQSMCIPYSLIFGGIIYTLCARYSFCQNIQSTGSADFLIAMSENIWVPRLILGLHPANKWRCYKVTPSRIGWAQP